MIVAGDDGAPQALHLTDFFTDPDGDSLEFTVPQVIDSPIIEDTVYDAATGNWRITYAPYVSGDVDIPVTAQDASGRFITSKLRFTLPKLPDPTVEIRPPSLNRQTGLIEQTVLVTNTAQRAIGGFQLVPDSLPKGFELRSPLSYTLPVDISESVALTLEWYSPTRALPGLWQAHAELQLPLTASVTSEGVFEIDRVIRLTDGAMLVEFNTIPGQTYEIQYSDNGQIWFQAGSPVKAHSNRLQWIDQGPAKTYSHPMNEVMRLYRVAVPD